MSRTRRAALQAAAVAFALVAGTTVFLGGSLLVAAVAGLVLGAFGAALVLGAAARAGYASDDRPRSDGTTAPGTGALTPGPTLGDLGPSVAPPAPTAGGPAGDTPSDLTGDDEDDERG